jgi:SAM-dependent methyltransferase
MVADLEEFCSEPGFLRGLPPAWPMADSVLPVPVDPKLYAGSARHYRRGRAGYSPELPSMLSSRLGLDGSGTLVDEGCGPGVLTVPLAPLFEQAFGLDPDPGMLSEARQYARDAGVVNARFIEAPAEDTASVLAGPFRVAAFGQSFHWTNRQRVAEMIFDLLEPGGALVLVHHTLPSHGRAPVPEIAVGSVLPHHTELTRQSPSRRSPP